MTSVSASIFTSNSLATSSISRDLQILAEAIADLHGPVTIRSEQSGVHIYVACPDCLQQDGAKEASSKHLTINASRYLGTHGWEKKKYFKEASAYCHKRETKFLVKDLLDKNKYKPLQERGIPRVHSTIKFSNIDKDILLETDPVSGERIPQLPGKGTPLIQLPKDHPAITYLENRQFDISKLQQQFNCEFCIEELPADPASGRYYARLPNQFTDTPQGRVIFYVYINNVRYGWQARILDNVVDNIKYYYHPHFNKWEAMEERVDDKWRCMYSEQFYRWKPSKYKNAFGMSRDKALIGYDAAKAWNDDVQLNRRVAVLVEGPLDAARIGAPGIGVLGKYVNSEQARLLAVQFNKLIIISDNDAGGNDLENRARLVFSEYPNMELIFLKPPGKYKDIGEMPYKEVIKYIIPYYE